MLVKGATGTNHLVPARVHYEKFGLQAATYVARVWDGSKLHEPPSLPEIVSGVAIPVRMLIHRAESDYH